MRPSLLLVAGSLLLFPIGCGGGGGGGSAPADTTVQATELILNLGVQNLDDSGETPLLEVEVPADAISLTVEGVVNGEQSIGLMELRGPAGRVYAEDRGTGPYRWRENPSVFSTTVPNTDLPELGLVPGGGTYEFRLGLLSGPSATVKTMSVRTIVERRDAGATLTGTLDLNVWLARSLPVDVGSAPEQFRLQGILSTLDTLLAQQGIRVGRVSYFDVADTEYDQLTQDELPDLLRLTSAAPEVRANLFFVQQVYGGGTVGASPTISGPARNGTRASGIAVQFDGGLMASTTGAIAAHELCHLLGLYHTVERDGSHDPIQDTLDCDPTTWPANSPCQDGAKLLMHWEYLKGTILTAGQGLVIRGHPLVSPGRNDDLQFGTSELLMLPPTEELPEDWCATCAAGN